MRWSDYYGAAAAMGMSANELKSLSLWEFQSCLAGYVKANSTQTSKDLTNKEIDELSEMLDRHAEINGG